MLSCGNKVMNSETKNIILWEKEFNYWWTAQVLQENTIPVQISILFNK